VGAEALIRWNHPARGLVPPGDFISIAETSGLIAPMGDWVLRTACAQNKAWQNDGLPPFRVAVNVSARQFLGDDLVSTVKDALENSGLDPKWLELEITESMVITDVNRAIEKLEQLNELGVMIALDDFGTGYSSLTYIKRFPICSLKIDQSFVQDLTTSSDDAAIIDATIMLAHGLGLRVIAEGVESKDQYTYLALKGCDEVQGFYFGRPQPAGDFVEWVTIHSGLERDQLPPPASLPAISVAGATGGGG
jgi:EAL domain-containing protein (putative c-di-GMP-specific phosphodiesterase class I)